MVRRDSNQNKKKSERKSECDKKNFNHDYGYDDFTIYTDVNISIELISRKPSTNIDPSMFVESGFH